ncbi:hypothetical protein CRM22_009634 [Opisthorchis felineus]|uniref:Uncharacterized protein n=1 Tax=Opisthorchis felineus TaxID=147828 RepID=A0A4S2LDR0_OPIFE|nr:hypothetical protein CRM22_009634 [Opisthorchis felineus]
MSVGSKSSFSSTGSPIHNDHVRNLQENSTQPSFDSHPMNRSASVLCDPRTMVSPTERMQHTMQHPRELSDRIPPETYQVCVTQQHENYENWFRISKKVLTELGQRMETADWSRIKYPRILDYQLNQSWRELTHGATDEFREWQDTEIQERFRKWLKDYPPEVDFRGFPAESYQKVQRTRPAAHRRSVTRNSLTLNRRASPRGSSVEQGVWLEADPLLTFLETLEMACLRLRSAAQKNYPSGHPAIIWTPTFTIYKKETKDDRHLSSHRSGAKSPSKGKANRRKAEALSQILAGSEEHNTAAAQVRKSGFFLLVFDLPMITNFPTQQVTSLGPHSKIRFSKNFEKEETNQSCENPSYLLAQRPSLYDFQKRKCLRESVVRRDAADIDGLSTVETEGTTSGTSDRISSISESQSEYTGADSSLIGQLLAYYTPSQHGAVFRNQTLAESTDKVRWLNPFQSVFTKDRAYRFLQSGQSAPQFPFEWHHQNTSSWPATLDVQLNKHIRVYCTGSQDFTVTFSVNKQLELKVVCTQKSVSEPEEDCVSLEQRSIDTTLLANLPYLSVRDEHVSYKVTAWRKKRQDAFEKIFKKRGPPEGSVALKKFLEKSRCEIQWDGQSHSQLPTRPTKYHPSPVLHGEASHSVQQNRLQWFPVKCPKMLRECIQKLQRLHLYEDSEHCSDNLRRKVTNEISPNEQQTRLVNLLCRHQFRLQDIISCGCQCSKTELPLLTDLELDVFLNILVPPDQAIVLSVFDSRTNRFSENPTLLFCKRLYTEQHQRIPSAGPWYRRTGSACQDPRDIHHYAPFYAREIRYAPDTRSPCGSLTTAFSRYRFLSYDLAYVSTTNSTRPLLQQRYGRAVRTGNCLIFIGGKLCHLGDSITGYPDKLLSRKLLERKIAECFKQVLGAACTRPISQIEGCSE